MSQQLEALQRQLEAARREGADQHQLLKQIEQLRKAGDAYKSECERCA